MSAMTVAFAESWERLWYERIKARQLEVPFPVLSSNGMAAGPTLDAAVVASRSELIERAVVLSVWATQHGTLLENESSPKALFLRWLLLRRGWTCHVRRIAVEHFGDVLIGFAQHPKKGTVFDSVHVSVADSYNKLLGNLLRMATTEVECLTNLASVDAPLSHGAFYRDGERNCAFDFLAKREQELIKLPTPELLKTFALTDVSIFPALAISHHPNWPPLRWGTQSIAGANPWPHPIA